MFGDRLKRLRLDKNLTQEELANELNMTKATVSNWENNHATPASEILKELAIRYNVSADYLVGIDYDKLERLKASLIELGIYNEDMEDMTLEDFQNALDIVSLLKKKKDTKE